MPKRPLRWRVKASITVILVFIFLVGLVNQIGHDEESADGGKLKMLFSFLATIALWVFWRKKQVIEPYKKNTEHGSAEWADFNTFEHAINPKRVEIPLGPWLGHGVIRTKPGHLITIAGSGAGKGTCSIIPTLLLPPDGSYIITDPKGENACITASSQKADGQNIFILDPWDEQSRIGAIHKIPASGFNPFDFLKENMDELRDNCDQIAYFLVPERPGEKDPYWNDRARALIKVLLMHIITAKEPSEHNFWALYKMLRLSGDEWLNLMLDLKENTYMDGLISIAGGEFLGMDPGGSALSGIKSSAQNATTIFESPQLRKSLEQSDLNPYDLTKGKSTVYIVIPERYLDTHGAWLRLVIGLCLKACNARPKEKVTFLLDEFAVMGKMKDIQKAYAFARGQNITLWFFAQSLSQIKEIYGEDGMNAFLSNTSVLQAFGIKDEYTKNYISKALGEATLVKASKGYSDNGEGETESTNYSSYARSLLTPEEVEKQKHIITFSEGLKLLLQKVPYFENGYTHYSGKENYLSEEQKKIIKSGNVIEDIWQNMFLERADPAPRVYS